MVHGCGAVPFRATEHPQLISYVSPAREIKPFQKDTHSVNGRLVMQAQISPRQLMCKTEMF